MPQTVSDIPRIVWYVPAYRSLSSEKNHFLIPHLHVIFQNIKIGTIYLEQQP